MNVENYLFLIKKEMFDYAPSLVMGLLVLFIGLYVSGIIANQLKKSLRKSDLDEEVSNFLGQIVKILLRITVFISVLSILGVKTSSFLALLGSAGLAIGLALQGSLSNFAGGVLILVIKPFKLEDFIEYSGVSGNVESIDIFTTKIRTPDNKVVIIPNGPLANGVVVNASEKETRRNEWIFGIGYNDDISLAKKVISNILEQNSKVSKDPAPMIAVHQLAESSVNIVVRAWTKKEDLFPVYYQTLEEVKLEFDKNSISIPYPQSDVHLMQTQQ